MGRSLKDLAVSMRARAKRLPEMGNYIAKEGAEAILREWVQIIPADTSQALSNTRIGIGQRPMGELPAFFVGHLGSTRGPSGDRVLSEGLAALAAKRPGQSIFVSNTAKHIGKLDRGTSASFAGGFVPRALIVFRLAVQDAKKRWWE